jgi:hypothetical protein
MSTLYLETWGSTKDCNIGFEVSNLALVCVRHQSVLFSCFVLIELVSRRAWDLAIDKDARGRDGAFCVEVTEVWSLVEIQQVEEFSEPLRILK